MFLRGIVTILEQQGVAAMFFNDAMRHGVQVIHLNNEPVNIDGKDAVVVTFEFKGDENAINTICDEYSRRYPSGNIEIKNDYSGEESLGDLHPNVETKRKASKKKTA